MSLLTTRLEHRRTFYRLLDHTVGVLLIIIGLMIPGMMFLMGHAHAKHQELTTKATPKPCGYVVH